METEYLYMWSHGHKLRYKIVERLKESFGIKYLLVFDGYEY
jgi:hypothetical protein